MSNALRFAIGTTRAWTRFYTCGLPTAVRDRRRAEIDSDLWELQHDTDDRGVSLAWQVWSRLGRGALHDLYWRLEVISVERMFVKPTMVACTAVVLLAGIWVVPLRSGPNSHQRCTAPERVGPVLADQTLRSVCECHPVSDEPNPIRPEQQPAVIHSLGADVTRVLCRP